MKEKMKQFVEDHKTAMIVIGASAVSLTCGLVGYKLGGRTFGLFKKSIGNDKFFEMIRSAIDSSTDYYGRTFGPNEIVKFKDLTNLAKDAIDCSESGPHMEDNIVGLFILTRTEG